MTTEKTVRITKAQRFADIKALLSGEKAINGTSLDDAKAFIDHEVELLTHKNASKSSKLTPNQQANENFKAMILDFLSGQSVGVTCTEIAKGIPALSEFNNQKVSALMRSMTYDAEKNPSGTVDKAIVKGKSLFTLR